MQAFAANYPISRHQFICTAGYHKIYLLADDVNVRTFTVDGQNTTITSYGFNKTSLTYAISFNDRTSVISLSLSPLGSSYREGTLAAKPMNCNYQKGMGSSISNNGW